MNSTELEALNRAVDGTAKILDISANRLQQAMIMLLGGDDEEIARHYSSVYRQQLLSKACDIRRTVRLLNDSARRLRDLLGGLETGKPVNEICKDIYAYGNFLCDQLLSEAEDACRIVKTMRVLTKETERDPT